MKITIIKDGTGRTWSWRDRYGSTIEVPPCADLADHAEWHARATAAEQRESEARGAVEPDGDGEIVAVFHHVTEWRVRAVAEDISDRHLSCSQWVMQPRIVGATAFFDHAPIDVEDTIRFGLDFDVDAYTSYGWPAMTPSTFDAVRDALAEQLHRIDAHWTAHASSLGTTPSIDPRVVEVARDFARDLLANLYMTTITDLANH